MDVIFERVAALDVHKAQVTACVRMPGEGGREQQLAEFQTTVRGLLVLRDWLEQHNVTHVVMEATGASGRRLGRCSRSASTVCSSTRAT